LAGGGGTFADAMVNSARSKVQARLAAADTTFPFLILCSFHGGFTAPGMPGGAQLSDAVIDEKICITINKP
jgi:hypothetical protein